MESNWTTGIIINIVFIASFFMIIALCKEASRLRYDGSTAPLMFMVFLVMFFTGIVCLATWEHNIIKYFKHRAYLSYLNTEQGKNELYLQQKQKKIEIIAQGECLDGGGTKNDLELRIRNMYNLNQNIQTKQIKVLKLSEGLKFDIQNLGENIKNSKLPFALAIRNPTVSGQLRLLQRKKAYFEQLVEINKQLTFALNELLVKLDEAYTDLQMVKTLGQVEAEKLMVEIDRILKQYRPYADDKIIDQSRLRFSSLDGLWREIKNE
ncbi:hypothetical protein KAU09_02090 [Candidatus Parcubacteria bacterium]|nr:hypothetical protein [Candidatus Parcubacteria bacterium]